jgi:DNA-binding Lrp family transcriptional regulator
MGKLEKPLTAYVFIEHLDTPDPKQRLRDFFHNNPSVKFVGRFVGSFFAFARVQTETLQELLDLIAVDFWQSGVQCSWSTVVGTIPNIPMPKKSGTTYCALLKITTSPDADPFVVMEGIASRFKGWPDHFGIAVVTGEYDILVTIGAKKADDLLAAIVKRVRKVKGIAATETAFSDLTENELSRA